jgi:hypothetical protein
MQNTIDRLKKAMEKAAQFPDNWAPALLQGTITNIQDPLQLGRAKILLDHFSSEDGTGFETDWLMPLELNFEGLLPRAWLNRKVLCHTINHSYETMLFSLGSKPLVYNATDARPAANSVNEGLTIVCQVGSESYLATCLRRNNVWVFEYHCPIFHLHGPGDTMFQGLDTGGDTQQAISAANGSDQVFITTATPYFKDSGALPPPIL